MSAETMEWLNRNTLIGFTDQRGHAWHYRADEQGDTPNHYPGAVPVADVRSRLFNWDAVEGEITATANTANGVLTYTDPKRKAIMRSDTGKILGVFKESYQPHQYHEWLLNQISTILDDDLCIGSAGLLRDGAQAWVQVEVPDTITTPEGVTFRPHLLAATSFDGSLATTYGRTVTNTVCDNTMSAALGEMGVQKYKVKHSRHSHLKINDAHEALAIVHATGDAFSEQVAELCNTTVTPAQWERFLNSLCPMPTEEGRGQTMAINKHDNLNRLWNHDDRVEPWSGTAWGVVQAVNTYTHHEGIIKGNRAERNMARAVSGGIDKLDSGTLATLTASLA